MVDTSELAHEQAYFNAAWEWRERSRDRALNSPSEGNRYDVRALRDQNRAYAERLADPDVEVAHGAIALEDGEVLYVGRNTIVDGASNRLVINWRSKVGELFERATAADPRGVRRKRQFLTVGNAITSFKDTLYAELAEQVARLSEPDAATFDDVLLADLDTGRTGAMRDIVATIQASQSGLIRHDADAMLLVQGGPGTGKSAVALHRVSWLLFNEEGLRPDRVLIIAPNDTFSHYIKDVLPGLGDVNIPQTSLRRLGPQKSSRRIETADAARVKGEARMAGLIARALHLRIRFAGEEPALIIGSGRQQTFIPRTAVEAQLEVLRRSPTYNAGRAGLRSWLSDQVAQAQLDDGVMRRAVEVDMGPVDAALDRLWPSLTAQSFLRELLGSQNRLQEAAGDAFTAGDIGRLHRPAAQNLASETWTDSDVALLDEADFLIRGTAERYDHIVVDEAQDLSPMQLRSVSRRSANGRYTIVGDIAQSTGPWARDTWDDVVARLRGQAPVVIEHLEYGYRVPQEVYDVAARLLPVIAPGMKPLTVVRPAPASPEFIADDGDLDLADEAVAAIEKHAMKGRFIGVIVAPEHKDHIATELRARELSFSDADGGNLGSSINLISATEAKGLEFDAVVVVEPAAIADIGDRGARLLYIALTRATKYLTVVHARAYPPLGLEGVEPIAPPPTSYTEQLMLDTRLGAESPLSVSEAERAPARPPSSSGFGPNSTSSAALPIEAGRVNTPTGRPLSPMLAGAAKIIAEQVRDEVQPDRWADLLAEIARQLDLA